MTKNSTVYIVDDNDEHRDILRQLVEHDGFNVESFSTGKSFLEIDRLDDIGCIILDNQMPEMSGLDVQKELIASECNLPVIFISGGSEISEAVQAVREGALGFLEKPIQSKDLIGWITKAIDHCKIERGRDDIRQDFENRLARLTTREKEVFGLVIRGRTNKMIASELDIKLGTVEFHRANMMDKMGAGSFSDLMELTHAANPLLR